MLIEPFYLKIENGKVDKEKLNKRKYKGLVVDLRQNDFNMVMKTVKSETRLPVLVKGVISKEDALECLDYHPDGIIVTCGDNFGDQLTAVCLYALERKVLGLYPLLFRHHTVHNKVHGA